VLPEKKDVVRWEIFRILSIKREDPKVYYELFKISFLFRFFRRELMNPMNGFLKKRKISPNFIQFFSFKGRRKAYNVFFSD